MPGRSSPATDAVRLDAAAREQRVDQGAGRVPGRRVRHQAGRLVDDQHVLILVDDRRAGSPPPRSSVSTCSGMSSSRLAPRLEHGVALDRLAVDGQTALPRSAAGRSVRDRPTASATTRSARRGGSDGGTVTVTETRLRSRLRPLLRGRRQPAPDGIRRRPRVIAPGLMRRAIEPIEHDQQEQRDADRRVGDVERVPAPVADAHVDEVDDVPIANAIDEVAERAAQQQGQRDRQQPGSAMPSRHS